MATYHHNGCRLYCRFIFAIIGAFLGFSGSLCFTLIYKNYHCGIWAFVSGVLAVITLIMHLSVWKDLTYAASPTTFRRLQIVGIVSSVAGFAVFVSFLVKGILVHESGVQIHGWFIVTVWGWMTWKWGFLMFWYAKGYYEALMEMISDVLSVNHSEYET